MPESPPKPSLRHEVVRLGLGSMTYFFAMVVTRGLTFLLTPVYTRYMSPSDYGIVGLASSLVPMICVVLGLCTHSAASRLYYSSPDDGTRQRLLGTVLSFVLVVPVVVALVLEILGSTGLLRPFQTVPYSPYLRLVLWASVLIIYPNVALNMMVIREEHRRAAIYNAATVLLTAGFTVLLVVVLRKGAVGQLLALLITNALMASFAIVFLWRLSRPVLDRKILRQVLLFSLPLVPHELLKWVLAASDRVILERWVTTAALGNYALGYTFGNTVGIFGGAVGYAFMPMVNRKLAEKDPRNEVPALGTIVILVSAFVTLGASVVLPSAIRMFTPPAYHAAASVVPWVALALFFQSIYTVWSQGTVFSRRTAHVALVTAIGAGINIGLNLIFVPRYGIMAAAVSTAIGYAVMALLHAFLAHKLFPIAWEYGRVARIAAAALVAYGLAVLPEGLVPLAEIFVRGAVACVVFIIALTLFRAVSKGELRRMREILAARRASRKSV